MSGENELLVRRIREGTVIDHIPAGRALAVLSVLGISGREGMRVAVVMNVESKKLGKKDIVKIEGKQLDPGELSKIALIAPTATINIVENYRVVRKEKVRLPKIIRGILSCPNPTCITRQPREPISSELEVVSEKPLRLVCAYCGTLVEEEDVVRQLAGRGLA